MLTISYSKNEACILKKKSQGTFKHLYTYYAKEKAQKNLKMVINFVIFSLLRFKWFNFTERSWKYNKTKKKNFFSHLHWRKYI